MQQELSYPHLQNLIKRDAASYRDDFLQQYQHFKASLAVAQLGVADGHFETLLTFISHVASYYEESRKELARLLMEWLDREAPSIGGTLRRTLVQCLLLLRRQKLVELVELLELLFKLLRVEDKELRALLYQSILGEICRANRPHRNNALNRTLQNLMYSMMDDAAGERASVEEKRALYKSLQITIELYRRRIWDDAHTVNVIAQAALSNISNRLLCTSLNFFIGRFRGKALEKRDGSNDIEDDDGEGEEEGKGKDHGRNGGETKGKDRKQSSYRDLLHKAQVSGSKHSGTMKRRLKRAKSQMRRKERAANPDADDGEGCKDQNGAFAAIYLLGDPQGFAEKLLASFKRTHEGFNTKLLLLNVISRVVGAHQLLLVELYSVLLRYLQPHQRAITQILAYAAQASHELVPPEFVTPLVTAIANSFVMEHCADEVIATGLNGLRVICSRCPLAMEADLLQNLTSRFKGYHDKSVIMAARSLIGLYRTKNPLLLHRRDRGKSLSIAIQEGRAPTAPQYGIKRSLHLDAHQYDQGSSTKRRESQENPHISDDPTDNLEYFEESNSEDESMIDMEDSQSECESESESESGQKPAPDIVFLASQKILSGDDLTRLRCKIYGLPSAIDGDQHDSQGLEEEEEEEGQQDEAIVDPQSLISHRKAKHDYAARMASIQSGREGRLAYGSRRGKHHGETGATNRVKAKRTKNAIMLAHKPAVRAKKRRSLREAQRTLLAHRQRQKRRK